MKRTSAMTLFLVLQQLVTGCSDGIPLAPDGAGAVLDKALPSPDSGPGLDSSSPTTDATGSKPDTKPTPVAGDAGSVPSADSTAGENPLYLALTVHLEGWKLDTKEIFTEYATKIREYSDLTHQYGANFTWETANLITASGQFGDNILLELQTTRNDGVGVHADLGGNSQATGETQSQFETAMKGQKTSMEALGVKVRHVSGICSTLDWVMAAINAGYEAATGTVEYCLKSLAPQNIPTGYESIVNCTKPNDCHDPYPSDPIVALHPWRAQSGANWVTADPKGKLILFHSSGSLVCLYESASNPGGSATSCKWDQKDVDEALNQIDFAVKNRDTKKMNQLVLVWSFGTAIDKNLLGQLLQTIKTKYVDTGKLVWKTLPQMIDIYNNWPTT
jgi:hypothetical protein